MSVSPARRAAHTVVVRTLRERRVRRPRAARRPRRASTRATGRWPSGWPSAPSSGAARSTGSATATRRGASTSRVRAALHLGLEQLLFLDGIADHAAIDESVELAKPSPGHRLVNAVLRRVQREGVELPADDDARGRRDPPLPPAVARRSCGGTGSAPSATRALLAADNEPAELALRVNPLAGDVDLADIPGTPRGRDDRRRRRRSTLFAHPALRGRRDHAAVARRPARRRAFTDPRPGERVLDLCAAPGGKTTHLAALMGGEGEVVAVERHEGRARGAASAPASARTRPASSASSPPTRAAFRDEARFDRVLLDPPCSGLGTLQAHPDLRWRVQPGRPRRGWPPSRTRCSRPARANLRPGGTLVYAVCTLNAGRGTPAERRLLADAARREDGTDGFYSARDGGR